MTKNNALISGLLGEHFKLYIMVPQRAKEKSKTSEVLPVSLPFEIQETKNNMEDRGIRDSTGEVKNIVIH